MKNVLITGASGYLGSLLIKKLSEQKEELGLVNLVGMDVRPLRDHLPNVVFENIDVRDEKASEIFKKISN